MHYDKTFGELTADEIIAIHLDQGGGPSFTTDFVVESTLRVTMRETRHCLAFDRSKNVMPCLGCFALLDQVGNCYTRVGMPAYPDANASGIKKALYYFAGFGANDPATKAMYAFRNALVHNASLRNGRNGVYYSFQYDSTLPDAVVLPPRAWDGQLATLGDDTTTFINPRRLVGLADAVVVTLNECLRMQSLQSTLAAAEIAGNYLLLVRR